MYAATRSRRLFAVLFFFFLSTPVLACLEIPPNPPDIWVEITGPQHINVIIHDYTTYASTSADFCTCALNIPSTFGIVQSATIVDSVTGVPLPGFSFGDDPDSSNGWDSAAPLSPPEFWSGFSSAVSQAIGAGMPVDIIFHIFNPERPIDTSLLVDHLQNNSSVVATDAADQTGAPSGAHQSVQPAGSVETTGIFGGLSNTPLGQATLQIEPDPSGGGNRLKVSNLGSSGKDGVSIDLGDTEGVSMRLDPAACQARASAPGDQLHMAVVGWPNPPPQGRKGASDWRFDSFFDIDVECRYRAGYQQSPEVPPPACVQVQVYHQGQLSGEACVPPGNELADWPDAVCLTETAWLEAPSPRFRVRFDQATLVNLPSAGFEVTGDEVHLFNPDLQSGDLSIHEGQLFGAAADSFFDIFIEDELPQQFGQLHEALGDAVFQPAGGHLTVSNIGSSGLDGVRSRPFNVDSFFDIWVEAIQDPDPNGGLATGAALHFDASGNLDSGGEQDLGTLSLTKGADGLVHTTADFSPVGSTTQRLELYNAGTLVGAFDGRSGDLMQYGEWPDRVGKLSSGWPPVLSCFVGEWNQSVEIFIGPGRSAVGGGGGGIFADEVRVLAEGGAAVDDVSSLSARAQGMDSLTLLDQPLVPLADSDLDGVADVHDNCVLAANGPALLDEGGNSQLDTDGDGIGNACDADLNQNCTVNFPDLGLFKPLVFSNDPHADFNGNGVVNFVDLAIMKTLFFSPPGPSGVPNDCP